MTEATLTVRVPLKLTRRGGRKLVISPEGTEPWAPLQARIDSTLVKALARAFRWRRQLETGIYSCVRDIAKAENINESYVFRVYRLTLLAPDIVEAILDGRQPEGLTLAKAMEPFPEAWTKQSLQFSNRPWRMAETGRLQTGSFRKSVKDVSPARTVTGRCPNCFSMGPPPWPHGMLQQPA